MMGDKYSVHGVDCQSRHLKVCDCGLEQELSALFEAKEARALIASIPRAQGRHKDDVCLAGAHWPQMIEASLAAARARIAALTEVASAAQAYRTAETDGTPRMFRGKALQDLASALDAKLAALVEPGKPEETRG